MQPLPLRMRPETIDDMVGQNELLAKDALLYKMIASDAISSIILYGPSGTGKTTIANVIANTTHAAFCRINAVSGSKKDIEAVCLQAQKEQQDEPGKRTILFIDEIHRFNKAQQDYLLPFVENGTVILIGATTENPFFEVNQALLSRSMMFELKPLSIEDIMVIVEKALCDNEKGLGSKKLIITLDALQYIAEQASGDVRHALSILELASIHQTTGTIEAKDVAAIIQKPHLHYDKDGDMHYNTISAFIKSMRGSDPDAVLYYLARLIESGEDPKFIARRIIIAASEDVGNADPMALVVATNASLAVERIGMPEGRIILSQAALYIAMAPKSNTSCEGIGNALKYIKMHPTSDIPNHLKDSHYKSAGTLGHGIGYIYPHDHPNHWASQQYLPDTVPAAFYKNSHVGYENTQADYQNYVHRASLPNKDA